MISFTPIHTLIAILWFISAVIDYNDFLHIWQLKEYRVDRMRDFFSTKKGQEFWKSYPLATRAILTIGVYVFLREIYPPANIILGIFFLDFCYNIYFFYKKTIKRPVITGKIIFISALALVVEIALVLLTKWWPLLLLFLAFRFLFLSIIVVSLYYPTALIKKLYIRRAHAKLKKYSNLKVVGITGSYGKTTVKHYLSQILSGKYRVICTPKNINTDIGVAKHILATDFSSVDIYIVEMGAYAKGEIKVIADMVKPVVGILTAINEEHLSLFGTLENTTKTKYELLRSLPKDGLAITNADNMYTLTYVNELDAPVQTFGIDEDNTPHFLVTESKNKKSQGIMMEALYGGQPYSFHIPRIFGAHNSTNIAACFLAAKYFGLSDEDLDTQIKTLTPPADRLTICNYGNATIVNDSYNSNPDGFRAALDVLGSFPSSKKRIVITRGLVELGEKSAQIHREIAEEISFYADTLIVISQDSYDAFSNGILPKYKISLELITDRYNLLSYLQSLYHQDVVILLENRMPSLIYDELSAKQKDCVNT